MTMTLHGKSSFCGNGDIEINVSMPPKPTYQLAVAILEETEGGYSIFSLNLPGVISQGNTEAEAIANVKDAFKAVMQYLTSENKSPDWVHDYSKEVEEVKKDYPNRFKIKWITADVEQ